MNADEALRLLEDECDHYLEPISIVRATLDRQRAELARAYETMGRFAVSNGDVIETQRMEVAEQAAELAELRAIRDRAREYRNDTNLVHPSASESAVHAAMLYVLGEDDADPQTSDDVKGCPSAPDDLGGAPG